MNDKVITIGAGISGITTALTLQLLGCKTTIYAEHLVDENAPLDPRFASLYPAASIIPHSIQSKNLHTIFPASLAIFEMLYKQQLDCIEYHRHFEVFEFPIDFPEYTKYLHNFLSIDEIDQQHIPHRADAPDLYGWAFDCFVTQWPQYMQQMYDLYEKAGGVIHQQRITRKQISELPADYIINCTGVWSDSLFTDEAEKKIIRGHLLHIPNQEPLLSSNSRPISYNYTPKLSIYSTPEGSPSDVYFYPINGKWVLGGSRQHGLLTKNDNWEGKEHQDTIEIDGLNVPRQIIKLNQDLLTTTYQQDIDKLRSSMKARAGYRFTSDDSNDGLRLEKTETDGKIIIHNYGHGGAGVTLSWGCALNVLQLLSKHEYPASPLQITTPNSDLIKNLQLHLHQVYLNYFE